MAQWTGADVVAQTLQQLGVKTVFGLVGIPVVQIAEACISLGIRFIAFRNEQAASYAATAYGYLTGSSGVCLVVGGPGVLHAMPGIGNSSINGWPLLLIAGSCETHMVTKGAFQELDAVSLLTPHTKIAIRPALRSIAESLHNAYRTSIYGRPGAGFVDLPADLIQATCICSHTSVKPILKTPRSWADKSQILEVAQLIREAQAPLLVIGKGAAYARAEDVVRKLVHNTNIPFLPTPMGKGVVPDSDPSNVASARSTALKQADVVLVLGARLNWILHFGSETKWNASAKLIQVDTCAEEIGRNNGSLEHGLLGDVGAVAYQLLDALQGWQYNSDTPYRAALNVSRSKNEQRAAAAIRKDPVPLTYQATFATIKQTLARCSSPEADGIVYISEGANTMDISRSFFEVESPRLRLDAGTHATMGVGPAYAIAAHSAYNNDPNVKPRKIVCLEGDSAFGFSMAEVETMARYDMDILIFVINNGGIYHGDSDGSDEWLQLKENTVAGRSGGLRSTSLGWEVGYEKMAEMCGGQGYLVRNCTDLERAVEQGFHAKVPVVVNVIIESGRANKLVSYRHLEHDQSLVAPLTSLGIRLAAERKKRMSEIIVGTWVAGLLGVLETNAETCLELYTRTISYRYAILTSININI